VIQFTESLACFTESQDPPVRAKCLVREEGVEPSRLLTTGS